MKKKTILSRISGLMAALMLAALMPIGAQAAYSDVTDKETAAAVSVLDALDIIEGYPDGGYHPDEVLTRAQFCKIAVCLLGMEDSLGAVSQMTIFSDVLSSHWAASYINLAANQSLISGYGDGRFGPDDSITLGQAVAVLLRALGYSESEIGTVFPDDYMRFAERIGLDAPAEAEADSVLTRGDAALLLVDLLQCENKSGKLLCETMAADVLTDVILLENSGTSPYGMMNAVKLYMNGQAVWYAHAEEIDASLIGREGIALFDKHDRIFAFLPSGDSYTVKEGLLLSGSAYEDGKTVVRVYADGKIITLPRAVSIASGLTGSTGTFLLNQYGYVEAFIAEEAETLKFMEDAVLVEVGVTPDTGEKNCAMFYVNGDTVYYPMGSVKLTSSQIGTSGTVIYGGDDVLYAYQTDGKVEYYFRYGVFVEKNIYNTSALFWDGEKTTRYALASTLSSGDAGSSGYIMFTKQGHVEAFLPDDMPGYTMSQSGRLVLTDSSTVYLYKDGKFESYDAAGTFTASMQGQTGRLLLDWNGDAAAFVADSSTSGYRMSISVTETDKRGIYYDPYEDGEYRLLSVADDTTVVWNGHIVTWGDVCDIIGYGDEALFCYDETRTLMYIVIG